MKHFKNQWVADILSMNLYHGTTATSGPRPPHCRGFTITLVRTSLDEWSARRRDLYLTTHNTHNRQPCPRWDSNPQSHQSPSPPNDLSENDVIKYNPVEWMKLKWWLLLVCEAHFGDMYRIKKSDFASSRMTTNFRSHFQRHTSTCGRVLFRFRYLGLTET
jgi:hypothetical protein